MTSTCFCSKCGPGGREFGSKSLYKLHLANNAREEAGTVAKDAAAKILFSTLTTQQSTIAHTSHASREPLATRLTRKPKLDKAERHATTVRALRNLEVASQRVENLFHTLKNVHGQISFTLLEEIEETVARVRRDIDGTKRQTARILEAKLALKSKLETVEAVYHQHKQILTQQRKIKPDVYTAFSLDDATINSSGGIAQLVMFLAVFCHVVMLLSVKSSEFVLALVVLIVGAVNVSNDLKEKTHLHEVPTSLDAILTKFQLDGKYTTHAVCTQCHSTYSPTYKLGSVTPVYPRMCSFREFSSSEEPCGAMLTQTHLSKEGPREVIVKAFVTHDLKDYVATLLSDENLLKTINEACDRVCSDGVVSPCPGVAHDFFDGQFVRNFTYEDGKLFVDREDGVRLLFSLSIDFFNVNTNLMGGATSSCGIMTLACLNLPVDIRYLNHNVHLIGIIPGPSPPVNTQLNHYLRPVIDEVLEFWEPGVKFENTASNENSTVLAAIACAVCDLPAARKLAQLAAVGAHYFCTVHNVRGREHLGDTDFENWTVRSGTEMKSHAMEWKAAIDKGEQEILFNAYGCRYSEMQRLPYWDAAQQLAVDSMHALLEGLAQDHCRNALQLTLKHTLAANKTPQIAFEFPFQKPSIPDLVSLYPPPKQPTNKSRKKRAAIAESTGQNAHNSEADFNLNPEILQKHNEKITAAACLDLGDVDKIHERLVHSINADNQESELKVLRGWLQSKRKTALTYISNSLGIPESITIQPADGQLEIIKAKSKYTKLDMANYIANWRTQQVLESDHSPQSMVSLDTLRFVQKVILNSIIPSWMNPPPPRFGEAGAGSLKADEWRTVMTVHLPIALVLLWGDGFTKGSPEDGIRKKAMLAHSMHLSQAILVALSRSTSQDAANRYRAHLKEYVRDLPCLYPHCTVKDNHHIAFHIYDFLLAFGPVRSWWCFPLERLIGTLQQMPTNNIHGVLEGTLLRAFVRGANLRRWLDRKDALNLIKEAKVIVNKFFGRRLRGTMQFSDNDSEDLDVEVKEFATLSVSAPEELRVALNLSSLTPKVYLRSRLKLGGAIIATQGTHRGNSQIMFSIDNQKPVPAVIKYIYSLDNDTVNLAVQCLQQTDRPNPFHRFPDFPAMLRRTTMEGNLIVISPENISGYFVSYTPDGDPSDQFCVVLPVSKV